ncbi:MAG: iron-containing alcohol dehydrogenase [Acidobacteriota bacterium]
MNRPHTLPAAAADRWSAQVGTVAVRFGAGCLMELGEAVLAHGGSRVFLVTDPGVRAAGIAPASEERLRAAGLAFEVFDGVSENPTASQVTAGVEAAREFGPDFIVAVGGGSAMDCAKGINLVLINGGRIDDYEGRHRAPRPLLPSVGVPTTAGTGSEAQSFALISRDEDHRKMACGDQGIRFREVLLDPEVLVSVPAAVAARSGLDAVSHAVESYVTRAGHAVSRMLAREAWRLLDRSLEGFLADPGELEGAADVFLGAHLAGAAIEQSMLGAAHACANPLTARWDIPHGAAVALMLPAVVRFNASVAEERYGELLPAGQPQREGAAADKLARRLETLRAAAGLPGSFADCGAAPNEGEIAQLASQAATQWTGTFNPRSLTPDDFARLYASVR